MTCIILEQNLKREPEECISQILKKSLNIESDIGTYIQQTSNYFILKNYSTHTSNIIINSDTVFQQINDDDSDNVNDEWKIPTLNTIPFRKLKILSVKLRRKKVKSIMGNSKIN